MHAEQLATTIETYEKLGRYLLIEGSPGLGKSAIPEQVADKLGIGFIQFHVPTMQPEDMAMPIPAADRLSVNWVVNDRMPVVEGDFPDRGILLLDELGQGDVSIQKLVGNLTQARDLYGRKLMENWTILATGNRLKDRAGAIRILSHLADRGGRVELTANLGAWCNWALANNVNENVISYIRFSPDQLDGFDPEMTGFPTPRSWAEGISPLIDVLPHDLEHEVFSGEVGEGAATQFRSFLKMARELPNPDVVLLNPDTTPIPEDKLDVQHALAGALAHRASANNFEAVATVAKRLRPEIGVYLMRDSVRLCEEVQDTRAFVEWALAEGADILT